MKTSDESSREDARLGKLGERLRAVRRQKGMTLAQVADLAGVTKGFLSLLERGHKSVSVPTLLALCEALDIELAALFSYPKEEVIKGGIGAPLEMGGRGIVEYLLTPAAERHIQVMRTILEPAGGSGGTYHLDCDTIFVLVVRGQLELNVGGRKYLLQAEDCTTFSGRSPHGWHNPGELETEVIWVLSPPLPGAAAQATI